MNKKRKQPEAELELTNGNNTASTSRASGSPTKKKIKREEFGENSTELMQIFPEIDISFTEEDHESDFGGKGMAPGASAHSTGYKNSNVYVVYTDLPRLASTAENSISVVEVTTFL